MEIIIILLFLAWFITGAACFIIYGLDQRGDGSYIWLGWSIPQRIYAVALAGPGIWGGLLVWYIARAIWYIIRPIHHAAWRIMK